MTYLVHFRSPILLLLTILLSSTGASGQEKYRLQNAHAAGDVVEVESTFHGDISMQPLMKGKKLAPMLFSNRDREQYRETVLSVDDKGMPDHLQRTYTVARSLETEPGNKPKQIVSSYQGKTVTIQRNGSKPEVKLTVGKLNQKDRKHLEDALRERPKIFPDHELAVGEEWTIDPKDLAMVTARSDTGSIKAKLLEIVPFQGHQCARIQLVVEVTPKPSNNSMPMTMKLSGDAYHALDIQRLISLQLSGPVTTQGEIKEGGMTMTGKGTMKGRLTNRWIKVAGKALAAQPTSPSPPQRPAQPQ